MIDDPLKVFSPGGGARRGVGRDPACGGERRPAVSRREPDALLVALLACGMGALVGAGVYLALTLWGVP